MKLLISTFLIAFSGSLFGQSESVFFNALKNVDVTTMESYLEETIDFCLFEDQKIMGKKAAMNKLKGFLGDQKIMSVEIMHKGASKDRSSQYKVAKLITNKETYRVFVFAVGDISEKSIKEIRIDRF
ncbi:MAG: DUF4783 domain-containing protein [Saprospiraceae bacterium]